MASAAGGGFARAREQHDLALHDVGEMILDGGMDVGDVEGDRQPARERVEIAHVDLALARELQLPAQAGGELADHDGDDHEQHQVEDLLRVPDAEAVERRIKEEGGGQHPADGGDDRRHDAPAHGRDQHRNEIEHRAVFEPDFRDGRIDAHGDRADHGEREQNATQFLADTLVLQEIGHRRAC